MLWLDAALAFAHFLFLFMLLVSLGAEAFILRLPMSGDVMQLLLRIDRAYGISAGLLVVAGVSRVMWGAKGGAYYMHEPFFWAKMATFVAVGLISIAPTMTFFRWRKALVANASFLPADAETKRVRGLVLTQLRLLVLVMLFAVLMARGYGT